MPADFQIAVTSEPMRIDPPAVTLGADFDALCDQLQRRDRQHQAEPLQR